MITDFCSERSILGNLTDGGSYSDSKRDGTITRNGSSGEARQARKTAAISLQVNYLLSLFPLDGGTAKKSEASSDGNADASWDQSGAVRKFGIPRWKRALDLTCTLVTMPAWLVVMAFIAIWIKLTSPGPIFYRQTRIGQGGRTFTILKFRSMRINAETTTHTQHFAKLIESNASMVKLDALGDTRVIPGGCCIRASGLDELPQLFNVLCGEMSLVGPRPCLPEEFKRYEDWHKGRVMIPPGLTGYWQVNGKNKTSFRQMVELDLLYANRMSLGLDLAVLLATIPAMLLQFVESRSRCIKADLRKRDRKEASASNHQGPVCDPLKAA